MRATGKFSRRQFLRGAAAAGVAAAFPAIVPASALGRGGRVAPSNRLEMGFIGVGGMGRVDLLSFLPHRQVQVVALCDVDGDRLSQGKQDVDGHYGNRDCRTFRDYRRLIALKGLDAVGIAVPDHWHALTAVGAAKAGLDIYGQKPLARSIREARAIVRAVGRYGRVWQTGSWQRSKEEFYRAAMLVRNGRIGKVSRIEIGLPSGGASGVVAAAPCPPALDWNAWLGPAPWRPYHPFTAGDPGLCCHYNWRWIMDYSGGQLTDWAGHHIDIAHWAMGKDRSGPVKVSGKGLYANEGIYNAPMLFDITCTYADGLVIRVVNDTVRPVGIRFFGEQGQWIFVDRDRLEANPESLLRDTFDPGEIHLERSIDHYQNFLDAVKSRAEPIAPPEVACRSISVGLLGEIAMLTGRTIQWDPDKEEILGDPGASELLGRSYREPWKLQI